MLDFFRNACTLRLWHSNRQMHSILSFSPQLSRKLGRGRREMRRFSGNAKPQVPLSPEAAKAVAGYIFADKQVAYNRKEAILYAVGVGETALQHVYEAHSNFAPLPTIPLILAFKGTSTDVVDFTLAQALVPPGLDSLPLTSIVHGEASIEILRPLPAAASELVNRSRVVALEDKGKGALLRVQTDLVARGGETLATHGSGVFFKGMGGFGGDRGEPYKPSELPKRAPDAEINMHTLPTQALLYRLSGDYNRLHIDPAFAKTVGFERPILHGLCTFAFAARAVLQATCNADPALFRSLKGRFAAPVYPGETLTVQLWEEGPDSEGFKLVRLQVVVRPDSESAPCGSGGDSERVVFSDGEARVLDSKSSRSL